MHKDFLTAIQNNEDPQTVYNRLVSVAEKAFREARLRYERDMEDCKRVLTALHEKPGSFMFEWAMAYRRQAELEEAQKSKSTLDYEARRREIEEEYLKELKHRTEYLQQERQQHHSDR